WDELISEAEAWLNVRPVGRIVLTLAWGSKHLAAHQWDRDRCATDWIVICHTAAIQRTRDLRIEPVLPVVAICARQRDVIPQPQVQGQLRSNLPIVLHKKAVLVVCGGRTELDFVVRAAPIPSIALRKLPHHETGHGISTAAISVARTHIGTIAVEAEEAIRSVGLNVVDLVNAAVKPELDVVQAVHLVERGRK